MTIISSILSGNYNNPAIWSTGTVPGVNDRAIVNHILTGSTDIVLGDSPAAGVAVLTIADGKSLTLNADLFLRGGFIIQGSGQLNFAQGHGIEFDPSNAISPSTAAYLGIIGDRHDSTPALNFAGALGVRCFARTRAGAATTAYAQLTDGTGPWRQAGLVNGNYVDFARLGDASRPAMIISVGNAGVSVIQNFTLDTCGAVERTYNLNNTAIFELKSGRFLNSTAAYNLKVSTGGVVTSGGSRKIWDVSFDKTVHLYPPQSFDIQRCYLNQSCDTTDGDWSIFKDNFVRITDAQGVLILGGDFNGNYVFYDEPGQFNPHYLQALSRGRDQLIVYNVFDMSCNQTGQEGDCVIIGSPGASCTATIKNNLIVRGPSDKTVGTLFSALGNANSKIIAEHNTVMTGNQGAAVGETYAGFANMVLSFKSNLMVSKLGSEGYKLYDSGTDDSVSNLVLSANADYNSGFGLLAGSNLKGYHHLEFASGSPGAHDVDGNPVFVDDTRNLKAWSTYKGGAGTYTDALTRLAADTTLIADLVTWVKGGFYVQNAAINGAGHDGITIGALPYVSAVSISALPTSLVANSVNNVVTVTGVGTSWTAGTPGSPTFTAAGVTGAAVTSQVVNNATSATLHLTASTGGAIGNITISDGTHSTNQITIVPNGFIPVPQTAGWWAIMSEFGGYLKDWYLANNHPANDAGLGQAYYDGEMCAYRLKYHFGTSAYDTWINEEWLAYVEYYVLPNSGLVQGFRNFTEGQLQDVLLGNARATDSLASLNQQLLNGAFVATGDCSSTEQSRECAYAMETHIHAKMAGITLSSPQLARLEQLKAWALNHVQQWTVDMTAPYFRSFMGALTAKALIDYYDNISSDPAIVVAVKRIADYSWSVSWRDAPGTWGAGKAFVYTDRSIGDPQDPFTQPDLNMLICPTWGWLYKMGQGAIYRTNGDQIFLGGYPVYSGGFHVSGADLGTQSAVNPAGKRIHQQLYWGPRYQEWAESVLSASMSAAPTTVEADTTNFTVTLTGVGTSWTAGTPGSPTFGIAGVTGAQITGQVVHSATSATLTIRSSTGGAIGTILISDGSIVSNGISVTPVVPPIVTSGTNARRRAF